MDGKRLKGREGKEGERENFMRGRRMSVCREAETERERESGGKTEWLREEKLGLAL